MFTQSHHLFLRGYDRGEALEGMPPATAGGGAPDPRKLTRGAPIGGELGDSSLWFRTFPG